MRILRFMGYPINNCSTLERMVLSQALALRQLGHELEIVFDGVKRPEAVAAARAFAPGVALHFDLPARFGWRQPRAMAAYLRRAHALIRQGRYDIVHLYFDPGARLLNLLARQLPEVRFLRTIGTTPLTSGAPWLQALKRRKKVWELAQMQRVVCVSQHIGDLLVEYGVPAGRIVVAPNATDVQRFCPQGARQPGPVLRLGFVGRLNPVKNLGLLVAGMRQLVAEGERGVHLTLIGDGEQQAELAQLVRSWQLDAYVRLAGRADDIPALLNREIDVYVQASHNEGCPAAVIEAMACAVPVLLSDIQGHRQVAEPERHASYFPAGDVAGFVAGVRRIQADYPHYLAQAARARAHVVAHYSTEAWIEKELQVYHSLMPA
ncbi:glycosyltransferase family 4 protein [Massilia sp. erpn]|uniref:glycosyltransferase family 4 protein n=1 Tax=Massilia sp. erpn TaxID=2738142 RepID=UPI002107D101|nr:glycosyltransferase family 4 protein [Massilia sp. erpn]UTY55785.1 glycosyltransferase family 4 protein [Massilia sp. erpn]